MPQSEQLVIGEGGLVFDSWDSDLLLICVNICSQYWVEIHKGDLNELNCKSQENTKEREKENGREGERKNDLKDFSCSYPHSSQKELVMK